MIAQALVFNPSREVLMVRQYVQRGDIVWNFPGGQVEAGETAEPACIREVKEETGYDVKIVRLLHYDPSIGDGKYSYLAEVTGGALTLDHSLPDNDDLLANAWVRTDDPAKWDAYTLDLLARYRAGVPAE